MNSLEQLSVILLAGGTGKRMGLPTPKQFLPLGDIPVALHSFNFFASFPFIKEIVVVCDPSYEPLFPKLSSPKVLFTTPGKERQDSVASGLEKISPESRFACIHDSARPFVKLIDFPFLYSEAIAYNGAVTAVLTKHTIKLGDEKGIVKETIPRTNVWEIHTPQIMPVDLLKDGLQHCKANNLAVTDDASILELSGHRVKLVQGSHHNIKITTQDDLLLSEYLLKQLS